MTLKKETKTKIKTLLIVIAGGLILSTIVYAFIMFLFTFFENCRDETGVFSFKFSFDLFRSYLFDKRVTIIGGILSIFIVSAIIIHTIRTVWFNSAKFVQKYKRSDSNMFGSAKLMDEKDKLLNFGTKEKTPQYYVFHKENSSFNIKTEKTGWVIASKIEGNNLKYLMYTKDTNMLTIGSPGTGKTQFFLMPNIVLNACNSKEQPTMIINDVKGELFNQTSKRLEDCGYRILNLNLRSERTSSRFNPFEIIWKYYQSYISILNFKLLDREGKIVNEAKLDLSEHAKGVATVFGLFEVKYGSTKDKLLIKFKNKNYGIGHVDLENGDIKYNFGVCEICNTNTTYQVVEKTSDDLESFKEIYSIQLFKDADYLDKTTSEILSLSSTIIPKGAGENQTWNTGSRGIIEGCIWGMLEDSCNPKLNMRLDKFILNNIGNIINGSPQAMTEWLKNRDQETSRALKAAAMIVDNQSEKTVSSYISNTQTLLKEYLTSGIAYITSASDFTLDDIVDAEKPVALYITIPDENATKYPIATLLIKEIYNYMIFKATKNKDNHLKRKAYFYLDEFAQMPKIDEFKQWVNASRSRWIYFNIIIQSVTQLYGTYKQEDGESIINACAVHLFLGSSDNKTVEFFHKELGNETVVTKSSSASADTFNKDQINANYSMQKKELVQTNELTEMKQGEAYFKIFRMNPLKTNFVPYFDDKTNKMRIFYKGEADVSMQEQMFSEKDSYYNIQKVVAIKSQKSSNDEEDDDDEVKASKMEEIMRQRNLQRRGQRASRFIEDNTEQGAYNEFFNQVKENNFKNDPDGEMFKKKFYEIKKNSKEILTKAKETSEIKEASKTVNNAHKEEFNATVFTSLSTLMGAENAPKTAKEMYKLKQQKAENSDK